MWNKLVLGLLLATLIGIGCGQTSAHKDPVPTPIATPTPSPTPTNEPIPLLYDKPAPGFSFENLLKGPYCKVKMKGDQQVYLLADVMRISSSSGNVIYFTYYDPGDGDPVFNSNVVTTNSMDSSTCDLAQLVDANTVPVLLAPIQFYADKDFSGEPSCYFEPGLSPFEDIEFDSTFGAYVRIVLKSEKTCKGLTYAYLKSIPDIVNLHLATQ